jgi:hypothetical protein
MVRVTTCSTCDDGWYPEGHDFGTWGTRVEQTFYLRNVGAQSATLSPDVVGGAPVFDWAFGGAFPGLDPLVGSWPGDAPICGATLAAGSACRIALAFAPPASSGIHGGLLSIAYSDAGGDAGALSFPLAGTSTVEPLVEIEDPNGGGWGGDEPPPIQFGSSGQDVTRQLLVVNRGGGEATLDGAALPAGFSWASGSWPGSTSGGFPPPCGATLGAGEECFVSIRFHAATLAGGTYAGAFTLSWGPGGHEASRQLTGTAVEGALVAVADSPNQHARPGEPPADFGTSGVPVTRTFYVTNSGREAAALTPAAFSSGVFDWATWSGGGWPGGDPADPAPQWSPWEGPYCGATLAAGATCRVSVRFTPPAGASEAYADAVAVAWSDSGSASTASRAVTGTATNQALVVLGDGSGQTPWPGQPPFDFGARAGPAHHLFHLRNDGGAAADLTASLDWGAFELVDPVAAGLPPPEPWEPADCPAALVGGGVGTLPAGASCRLAVRFTAPLPGGLYSTALVVGWTDANGGAGEVSRELVGTSIDGPLLAVTDWDMRGGWSAPAYDYGLAGSRVHHWFYVWNDGRDDAPITGFAVGAGWALEPLGEGESLPPGGWPPAAACEDVATLGAGERCAVRVTFRPDLVGPEGPISATLEVHYGVGAVATRELAGGVTHDAFVHVTEWPDMPPCEGEHCLPADLWATAGSTSLRELWVTNRGGADAQALVDDGALGLPFGWGDGAFPGRLSPEDTHPDACVDGGGLAPGASCRVVVSFSPTDPGEWLGEVRVRYVAGLSGSPATASRALRGTAAPPPPVE